MLKAFFHAAALTGRSLEHVLRWVANPAAADTPAEVPVVEQSHDRKEGGATELPYTGLELLPAGLAGMALLGLGAGLTFWRRRKTGEAA